MRNLIIILLVSFYSIIGHGQSSTENFNIFVLKSRYSEKGQSFIEQKPYFSELKLLGGYMLDPKNKGIIDFNLAKTYLFKLFPDTNSQGVLCINLENKLYQNLKNYSLSDKEFREATDNFIKLINLIRTYRPHVKLGIYGLPFRTYYPSQKIWNENEKFDGILSKVDYIFPSLYILFPDKEHGEETNDAYWKQNLDVAFSYADRLNKPVIPFVWYMVNPGNKKFAGELLGKKEINRYLSFIRNYKSNSNSSVKGMVWWEPSSASFKELIKPATHLNENVNLDNSSILIEYLNDFFK